MAITERKIWYWVSSLPARFETQPSPSLNGSSPKMNATNSLYYTDIPGLKRFVHGVNMILQASIGGIRMKKGTLPTSPQRSELMSRVRQHGTEPELIVRGMLSRIGAKYRLNAKSLPGSPDIANRERRKAIFIHGCFWHYHGECPRGQIPASNVGYWKPKLLENRTRDERKVADLRKNGFDVMVVWECELSHEDRLLKRLSRFWNRTVRRSGF